MARTHKAAAAALGREHGHNAATWADMGAIEQHAATIIADGEPEDWAMARSGPLSGEWAGDLTPITLLLEIGAERYAEVRAEDHGMWDTRAVPLFDAYEAAFEQAYAAELLRRARVLA